MNLPHVQLRKALENILKLIAGLFGVACLAIPSLATATTTIDLPAGWACEFDLRVEIEGNPRRVYKEFYDKNGNLVRTISAGKGNALTFTNLTSGASLALKGNGSVEHISIEADGTQTYVGTGHNVLILFPTDIPAGPSTTLYVGRIIFSVDLNGIFTVLGSSGKSIDICAALSG